MRLSQLSGINSPSNLFTSSTSFGSLPQTFASRILLFASAFAGLIFFVRIVISGYLYLTSTGDPGKVQSATKNFINSTIGLIIVVFAFFIAQIIFSLLGISGVTQ